MMPRVPGRQLAVQVYVLAHGGYEAEVRIDRHVVLCVCISQVLDQFHVGGRVLGVGGDGVGASIGDDERLAARNLESEPRRSSRWEQLEDMKPIYHGPTV